MAIDPSIFKEYVIRGVYPDTINYDLAVLIGQAFADLVVEKGPIAVGRDMRLSSPEIAKGLIEGITKQGRDVVDVGLITTDMIYFATGKFPFAGGIMITASHNPKEYNGLKFCLAKAAPVSGEGGIYQMRDNILNNEFKKSEKIGQVSQKNILNDWIDHALSFIDEKAIKPLKIVVDAGNGMASILFPDLKKRLPLEIIPLYFELDGSFPNHPAAPIVPENLKDAQQRVLQEKADLGLVFDGDGDRAVFIDETGRTISGTIVTAMMAEYFLNKFKGATILYNAICGWVVSEIINGLKGKGIRVPVGHSLIKENMRKYDALFAGEHSGHYFFKENYYADSAFITTLITFQIISREDRKLSEIIQKFDKYPSTGEINFEIADKEKVTGEVEKIYSPKARSTDKIDGLTVWFDDWWFNLRPSNTESLLRLNIEAKNQELLDLRKKEIVDFLKAFGNLAEGK
jgi:phosphomannomutase